MYSFTADMKFVMDLTELMCLLVFNTVEPRTNDVVFSKAIYQQNSVI